MDLGAGVGGVGGEGAFGVRRKVRVRLGLITLVGCPTSLSFLTTDEVASSSRITPVAEMRKLFLSVAWVRVRSQGER